MELAPARIAQPGTFQLPGFPGWSYTIGREATRTMAIAMLQHLHPEAWQRVTRHGRLLFVMAAAATAATPRARRETRCPRPTGLDDGGPFGDRRTDSRLRCRATRRHE